MNQNAREGLRKRLEAETRIHKWNHPSPLEVLADHTYWTHVHCAPLVEKQQIIKQVKDRVAGLMDANYDD